MCVGEEGKYDEVLLVLLPCGFPGGNFLSRCVRTLFVVVLFMFWKRKDESLHLQCSYDGGEIHIDDRPFLINNQRTLVR